MFPTEFITYTSKLFGKELWQRYVDSFAEPTPISIRTNPFKPCDLSHLPIDNVVPWCHNAFYLKERPNFTLDPMFHAGAYYVQEASSMFLDRVVEQHCSNGFFSDNAITLDLCAAPGGKSTLLRAALPEGVRLMSNEPDRKRANILMENMQKQGHPNVIVTNNFPQDYTKTGITFDLILADVPCSGEGMFRKDSATIGEWSLHNVMKCAEIQRRIVKDIWTCLKPGGILIYSTCTFNTHENEENVKWITEELGAEVLPTNVEKAWNVTKSLHPSWQKPVSRFIPGIVCGEGLFMAVIRKNGDKTEEKTKTDWRKAIGKLRVMSDGIHKGIKKGNNIIPSHAESLLITLPKDKYPRIELHLNDALRYLHHEAIILPPEAPRGIVIVTYNGLPLGFAKNIGNRANNLYPQEWRIRQEIPV